MVASAIRPLSVDVAVGSGLLAKVANGYRAGLTLQLVDDGVLLSDLPASASGSLGHEHVLGVGGAASTLRDAILDAPAESALDIGTGCGVQALRLSATASRVTATDLSDRALDFAATNATLNGVEWELLAGDMLKPIAGRRFDRVVSNPPFVVGSGAVGYVYRDSGRAGDGVCAELAASAGSLLNPGGTVQFLANWLHIDGEDWRERIASWFAGTGCDVWAIQRDVSDPLDYVRVWQRDAADEHDPSRLASWLDWFDEQRATGVGFGIITARRSDATDPMIVCEDLRHPVEHPYRDRIGEWLATADRLADVDAAAVLAARPRLADGVRLRQDAVPTADGWAVDRQLVTAENGMRRTTEIDPLLVSFLAGCTGDVDVLTLARLLAEAHDGDAALLAASLAPVVRELTRDGFLVLPG
ncbi:methyltransferase [Stackebrandtia soli]|uniref:DUF7782 domain-containing protein n=1 Tax=Stackebrandtia soli TaxID=1892856 RepID=UPI0039EC86D7